jgi:polyisoprenoid-binding protein YceI
MYHCWMVLTVQWSCNKVKGVADRRSPRTRRDDRRWSDSASSGRLRQLSETSTTMAVTWSTVGPASLETDQHMNRTLLAIVAMIAIGIGGYIAYDQVLRGDDTAPLALPSASPAPSDAATASDEPAASSGAPTASAAPAPSEGELAGTWTVVEGSEAGYRVREQLAGFDAETDAVGRTADVGGSITLTGSDDALRLTDGSITVDTTTIVSDEGRRDDRMRDEGLQTDQFPTATFTSTEPVDIPADAADGQVVELTLVGDLELHGVTRPVSIPATAQLIDGQIQVAGATTFALAAFDITAPNVGGFIISIADEGALEFLVVLARG